MERFGGQIIRISPSSSQYVNPMDINLNYSEEDDVIVRHKEGVGDLPLGGEGLAGAGSAKDQPVVKELQSQNERMFMVTFLVMNTGRTEQELETNVFQSQSIAQKHNCVLRMTSSSDTRKALAISRLAAKDLPEPGVPRISPLGFLRAFTGSLNIFNHRTNVDIENRIVCFDIKDLGKQMTAFRATGLSSSE